MENIKNQEEGLEKPKTKKERSPAQIESFKLAQEKRQLQSKMKKEQIENVKKEIKNKTMEELKQNEPIIQKPIKTIETKIKKAPKQKIVYYNSESESESEEEEIVYIKKPKKKIIKEKEIIEPVKEVIKEKEIIKNKIIFC
jgi:hypothetical protein